MTPKKLQSIFAAFAVALTMLPCTSASAEDTPVRYERVMSADEITSLSRYIIVGCPGGCTPDEAEYVTMVDYGTSSDDYTVGYRGAIALKCDENGILSLEEGSSAAPLSFSFAADTKGGYTLMTDDTYCLNGVYATGAKSYTLSYASSKGLPVLIRNYIAHVSSWTPVFRSDGYVCFKTSKDSVTGCIRLHHQANNGGTAVFSCGPINDSYIDLPDDGSLTYDNLDPDNIPVKTYLYREVCTHENAAYTAEKTGTCSEHGNTAYYYCSDCGSYLAEDKKTRITLDDTVLPFADHTNTVFTEAAKATCTEHGNIAYTYCADCGNYFEGNSTVNKISPSDIYTVTANHSYSDGVCSVCGNHALTGRFNRYGTTGDGSRYVFAAEYNGKMYTMGSMSEKGMKAAETEQIDTDILAASSETAAVAEEIPCNGQSGEYIKIGENYLKNASGTLTLAPGTESATLWAGTWGYNASGDYSYYLYDASGSAQICLVTDEEEPYFSLCETADAAHIASRMYGEMCRHPDGLVHTDGIEPTCINDGLAENWYCGTCGSYFSDAEGLNIIADGNTTLLAHGPVDADNDGLCDSCGKSMPVYTKVTSDADIVMGGKYILVSDFGDDCYYVLKKPDTKLSSSITELGIEMAAARIYAEEDGSFDFNEVSSKKALSVELDFACEFSDVEEETIRYALQTPVNNKILNLESYGGFCLAEYAKYGWRIALNEDATVKLADVYDNIWENGDGLLRVYRLTEPDSISRVFFSASDKSEHITKEGSVITSHPVCLYRLTDSGTVNDTEYTLIDAKSGINKNNIALPSENAVNMSNVTGISAALKKTAIESYVTDAGSSEKIHMNISVNITASDFIAADEKTGTGGKITYSLTPMLNVTTESDPDGTEYEISNDALDGSPITVTLYAGGVETQQIIHIRHDGTKEYFYPEWSEEVMQNGEKAFTQRWDSNGNMYVTFEITEFSEIVLLDTPERDSFSISGYDEKSQTVTVSCTKDGEYILIFADYEKEALNCIQFDFPACKAGTNELPLPKGLSLSAGDKIFLWDNLKTIQPLCGAYTIK